MFTISMADINKTLAKKFYQDSVEKLPVHYRPYLDIFDWKKADVLPLCRSVRVDYQIELEKGNDEREPEVP